MKPEYSNPSMRNACVAMLNLIHKLRAGVIVNDADINDDDDIVEDNV